MTIPAQPTGPADMWTPVIAIGRGVGVTACLRCGAVVILEPTPPAGGMDGAARHAAWHAEIRPPSPRRPR